MIPPSIVRTAMSPREAPATELRLRVAHWALPSGQRGALFLSDELEVDLDAPIFYDVSQP